MTGYPRMMPCLIVAQQAAGTHNVQLLSAHRQTRQQVCRQALWRCEQEQATCGVKLAQYSRAARADRFGRHSPNCQGLFGVHTFRLWAAYVPKRGLLSGTNGCLLLQLPNTVRALTATGKFTAMCLGRS